MDIGTLLPTTKVENEECCLCFNDFDDENGVNICLKCFRCVCHEHAKQHAAKDEHSMFLNRRRRKIESKADPTKLAIGVEGGFQDAKYEYDYQLRLYDAENYQEFPMECVDDENAMALIEKLKSLPNASQAAEVEQWELKIEECKHVKELKQPEEPLPEPHMHCSSCELENNLWLCLTCGYVGCGRRNFDGTGGNGHALEHFKQTGHPVCVKMGTISPDGRADLFCYACDETVTDSHIADHLKQLSINVQNSVKTESTTTELNVQKNKDWDFEAVSKDGKEFEKMTGPNSTGLINLGNTCYMNSVLQVLNAIPTVQDEFAADELEKKHWTDPKRQFYRLYKALKTGDRTKVSPRLLRTAVCRDRPDFMGGEQQDAVEFFQYLFNYISVHNPQTALTNVLFDQANLITCDNCHDVSTSFIKDQPLLVLTPPPHLEESELVIKIEDLLRDSLEHGLPQRKCDKCQTSGAVNTTLFTNFPEYLFVAVQHDMVGPTGMLKKANIRVDFDVDNFDLSKYRTEMKSEDVKVDENKVAELMNFGFSRSQCVRALQNVDNVEAAVQFIIDNPMEVSPAVQQVMEMGFSEDEARDALAETSGNVALAIEWLFGPRKKSASSKKSDGNGVYELIAFIQHKGTSALCGHYVATVRRNGRWVLYNDDKVAIYPADEPPMFGKGYLYLFHRK